MKKIFTTLLIASVAIGAQAQYQRTVLFEEFTQASCGPCASQNPGFNSLLEDNTDKATSIKYQVWWPGYDPMYLHNETDVNNRVDYYNISGVPAGQMDGIIIANDCGYYDGAPACVSQTDIDNAYAITSPFYIELSHTVAADYGSVDVEMYIATDGAVEGDFVAHIVIVEREILFATAPGSNGEKEFYNVMKKMLPSADGTDISDSWGGGDNITIMESWDLENVYNPSEIAVVAFIQDNTTKEVLQAAFSAPYPVYALDIMNVSSNVTGTTNPYLCEGTASPSVTISNIGENTLTSCSIDYSINGGATSSFDWSGSLAYGASATVNLPEISFTLEDENTLEVTISNPNGTADGFDGNNVTTALAFGAPEAPTNTIHLKLRTDQYPEETTWEIIDENDDIVAEGGPYNGDANQVVFDEDIILPASGCFTFNIYDSYGDGICCTYGSGYFEITDSEDEMLVEGGEFQSETNAAFKALELVSIDENSALSGISLYPNPAQTAVQLMLSANEIVDVRVSVYDMTGRMVMDPTMAVSGQLLSIPVAALANGMYLIQITGTDVSENLTFHVAH
jgi:hypothetical protein